MSRKIKLFIIIFLICSGLFLFLVFHKNSRLSYDTGDEIALANNSLIHRFNQVQEKYTIPTGPKKISNDDGYFLKLQPGGKNIYYYLPSTGQIKSVPILNKETAPSSIVAVIKPNFSKIEWSNDGKYLIASHQENMFYYNLSSNTSKKLDSSISNPVFSSNNNLAYLDYDSVNDVSEIRLTNIDFYNSKSLLKTRFKNWKITWLNSAVLGLYDGKSFFTLDINSGDFTKIFENKKNLTVNPSPNSVGFIYSYLDGFGETQLNWYALADQKDNFLSSGLAASGCLWSNDNVNIYCLNGSSVEILNIETREIKILAKDDVLASAQSIILSNLEDYLIFKNSQNQKIYSLFIGQE